MMLCEALGGKDVRHVEISEYCLYGDDVQRNI